MSSLIHISYIQLIENEINHNGKRKRTKDKSKNRTKKSRISSKEWSATSLDTQDSKSLTKDLSTISTQITYSRFEFNNENSIDTNLKKKKSKKFQSKRKKLLNTLKQVESEQNEMNRLQEENPDEGELILRSKHWKTALAKAKGEKLRNNIQLLRKSIKKQSKHRKQSAKRWQQNKFEIEKRMKERQEKRQTNIQKRKDDKKAKLKKKLIKKGRLVS